jgi:hypothetical protein
VIGRSVRIGSVVAVLVVALVIANQWRGQPQLLPPKPSAATGSSVESASSGIPVTAGGAQDSRSPSESPSAAPSTIGGADGAPQNSVPALQELEEVVEGIDPSLVGKNLILPARDPATKGPGLVGVEQKFKQEGTDPLWSRRMESQILDQVARVSGLSLVTLNAECRETICRVKLVYPPRTNALSSLEQLKPLAKQLGFGDIVEAATIGEDGVPMSLVYLQREGV